MKVNWRDKLERELESNGETLADVVSAVPPLDHPEWRREFNDGYGGSEGCSFAVWTGGFVYFPAVYDGSEWVESVPRNPNGFAIDHIGGE